MAVRMRNKRTGTTGTFSHPDVLSDEWVPVEPVEAAAEAEAEAEPVEPEAEPEAEAEPEPEAETGKTPTKKQ